MAEYDDAELVEQCKNGDRQAFNTLVLRNQQRVYWVIRRLINDHDDALDIAQDVFIRAYKHIHSFRGDSRFSTWLHSIATNLSINALRKQKLRSFFSIDDIQETLPSHEDEPDVRMEREEQRVLIERAIATLPEKQRIVFVLRYYEELTYEEIAAIVHTSVGGLKANYYHAVRKIEDYLRHAKQ